jgi:hypothetical protein
VNKRDEIAQALIMANSQVPLPWPMPPGEPPLMVVPPNERDMIERPAISEGYDANAVQGQDLIDQYFYPAPVEENI